MVDDPLKKYLVDTQEGHKGLDVILVLNFNPESGTVQRR